MPAFSLIVGPWSDAKPSNTSVRPEITAAILPAGSMFWMETSDSRMPFCLRNAGNVLVSASPAVVATDLPLRSSGFLMFFSAKNCTDAGVVCRNTPMLFTGTPCSTAVASADVSAQPKSVCPAPVACTVLPDPWPAWILSLMPCFS